MTPSSAWLKDMPAALEAVAAPAAIALGASAGLGLALFLAFSLRAKSRPAALLALPGAPLAAACFGQLWIHRAAARPGSPFMDRLAARGAALAHAHLVASAGLALSALLLTGVAVALGFAGGSSKEAGHDRTRRSVALVTGAIGAAAVAMALALGRGDFTTGLWLGLVPALLGAAAIAAGAALSGEVSPEGAKTSPPDAAMEGSVPPRGAGALTPAACAIAAAVMCGLSRGLYGVNVLDGVEDAGSWPHLAATWMHEIALDLRDGALFCVPLAAVLAIVLRRPARAFRGARRELAVLALAVGVPALASAGLAVHQTRGVTSAWADEAPEGFALSVAPDTAGLCGDIDTDRVLFVGPSRLWLGHRDLAPLADLDTDEGTSAIVRAVDSAAGKDLVHLAVGPTVAYGRLERLLRALAEKKVYGAPPAMSRRMRRLRCDVALLEKSATEPLFPVCTHALIASADCPAPDRADRTLVVLSGGAAYYHQVADPFAVKRILLATPASSEDRNAPAITFTPRSLAASDEVPAADVLWLAAPGEKRRFLSREPPRFVPAERVQGPAAPPPVEPSPLAQMTATVEPWTELDMPPSLRDPVIAASGALRACMMRPDAKTGHADIHLLVAADGSVQRVLHQDEIPGDGACVSRTLAALHFAPPRETVLAIDVRLDVRRAKVTVYVQSKEGESDMIGRRVRRALAAREADFLGCYAPALAAGRGSAAIVAEMDIEPHARTWRATPVGPREKDASLEGCVLGALSKALLPESAELTRRVSITLSPP